MHAVTETHDSNDLLRRAMAAHYRAGAIEHPGEGSGVRQVGGLSYVVLRTPAGVLAVYRVRNDGMLKGLRRWPRELD